MSWETSEFQCSHGARKQTLLRFFQKGYYLFTRNAREILKKFVNGISALQVINQVLNRNPRARETRRTAHDFGIDFDDGSAHASECGTRRELLQQLRRPLGFDCFEFRVAGDEFAISVFSQRSGKSIGQTDSMRNFEARRDVGQFACHGVKGDRE